MIKLAKEIGLDENLVRRLSSLTEQEKKKAEKCTEKCLSGNFGCLVRKSHIVRLAVILCCAVKAREEYAEKGIADGIFLDTMNDIKIWCENNGNKGLKNYGWIKNHVQCELFRLGRLQFQLYECRNRTLLYNKLPFSYGERLIYVHIPQGEGLEREKCIESLKTAEVFFAEHFPDYKYRYYFTESWLLADCNRDFMAEDSNIIKFASLFEHCYSVKIDAQAIERVFGKRRFFVKSYPEHTSLQKRLKRYMLGGAKPGIGVAVIDRDSFVCAKMM